MEAHMAKGHQLGLSAISLLNKNPSEVPEQQREERQAIKLLHHQLQTSAFPRMQCRCWLPSSPNYRPFMSYKAGATNAVNRGKKAPKTSPHRKPPRWPS